MQQFREYATRKLYIMPRLETFITYTIGDKEFDSLEESLTYACSLGLSVEDFGEVLSATCRLYRNEWMALWVRCRKDIVGYRKDLESLKQPMGFFVSLFTDNSKEIRELESVIEENEAQYPLYLRKAAPAIKEFNEFLEDLLRPEVNPCTFEGSLTLQTTEEEIRKCGCKKCMDYYFPFGTPEEIEEEKRIHSLAVERLKVEAMMERLKE